MKIKMKTIAVLSGVLSLGAVSAASAADMAVKARPAPPLPPPCIWCGFYIGVNGGWAFDGFADQTGNLVAFSAGFAPVVAAGGTPRFLGTNHEGGFGGGQIGYNWQVNQFVFGLEADIQGGDIGGTSTVIFPGAGVFAPSVSQGRDHLDWFGTARARLGIASGPVLFYATGGAAFGEVKTSASNIFNPTIAGVFTGATSDTRFGWTAGAGIEWAFAPNWTVKGEYLYVDLGSSNVTLRDPLQFPADFTTYNFQHRFDLARVGINYKFGGPVVARY
jgi:outer membrane immunogenic protein